MPKKNQTNTKLNQTEAILALQQEFVNHVNQEYKRFDEIHRNINRLIECQNEISHKINIIKDKVNEPIMVPLQNGKLEYKKLDEVVGEIWEYIHILREGSQLKQMYNRHKKAVRGTLIGLVIGILLWTGWTFKEVIGLWKG